MDSQKQLDLIIQRVRDWGISKRTAIELGTKYDLDLIVEHIDYTTRAIERGWVRNPAAWFLTSLRDGWGPPPKTHRRNWWKPEYDRFIFR